MTYENIKKIILAGIIGVVMLGGVRSWGYSLGTNETQDTVAKAAGYGNKGDCYVWYWDEPNQWRGQAGFQHKTSSGISIRLYKAMTKHGNHSNTVRLHRQNFVTGIWEARYDFQMSEVAGTGEVYNYTEDDQFATRYLYCTNTVQQFFVEFHIDTKAPFGIGDRKDVDFSVDTN